MAQVPRYRLSETPFTPEQFEIVRLAALEAFDRAYQPYSKFKVGCGLLDEDGHVVNGCNVETNNYDGTHAEENALGALIVSGRRAPRLCVIVGGREGTGDCRVILPCGKCRQVLHEFSMRSGSELWIAANPDPELYGEASLVKLSDLLPDRLPVG